MPSAKDIRKFSDTWVETFKWFEANPDKDFVIECSTKKQAESLRFEFYRARSALEKDEGYRAVKVETGFDMWENTKKRKVFIEGTNVIFRFSDAVPAISLLKEKLEQVKDHERGV